MITLPPYMYDSQIYPLLPSAERLFMNKLWLAEQLGHDCGPVGITPTQGVDLCVRPIMNLLGHGDGGFYKFNSDVDIEGLANRPGYFWCKWFDGHRTLTEYIEDVAVHGQRAVFNVATGRNTFGVYVSPDPLPPLLKGLSRYLLVERIGSNIIEVSFRHMGESARQASINDYRTIDPTYNPHDIEFGLYDTRIAPAKGPVIIGHCWETIENTRR